MAPNDSKLPSNDTLPAVVYEYLDLWAQYIMSALVRVDQKTVGTESIILTFNEFNAVVARWVVQIIIPRLMTLFHENETPAMAKGIGIIGKMIIIMGLMTTTANAANPVPDPHQVYMSLDYGLLSVDQNNASMGQVAGTTIGVGLRDKYSLEFDMVSSNHAADYDFPEASGAYNIQNVSLHGVIRTMFLRQWYAKLKAGVGYNRMEHVTRTRSADDSQQTDGANVSGGIGVGHVATFGRHLTSVEFAYSMLDKNASTMMIGVKFALGKQRLPLPLAYYDTPSADDEPRVEAPSIHVPIAEHTTAAPPNPLVSTALSPALSTEEMQFQIAQTLYRQEHYYQAANLLEKQPDHAPSQTLLLAAYEKLINILLQNSQLDEAKLLLSTATLANPMAESLVGLRTRLEQQYAASQQHSPTLAKSVRLSENAQTKASSAPIAQTKNVQTKNTQPQSTQSQSSAAPPEDTATLARIQALHDAAELAFGRHEFESAIKNWRQVLDLQSSNPTAQAGILRVKQLQEKLSQIK